MDESVSDSEFATVREAAQVLYLTVERVRQKLRKGDLPGRKIEGGRKWVIPRVELDRHSGVAPAPAEISRDGGGHESRDNGYWSSRASQMEASGHWPMLRKAAINLREQIWAPLPQLLDMSRIHQYNPDLRLHPLDSAKPVSIDIESGQEFRSLRQHQPNDPAWEFLAEWKQQIPEVRRRLADLVHWIKDRPEIRDWPQIPPEALIEHCSGMTDRFPLSLVLASVEDAYFDRSGGTAALPGWEREFALRLSAGDTGRTILEWNQGSTTCAIGADLDREKLEQLKRIHLQLRAESRLSVPLSAVVAAIGELYRIQNALAEELKRMELSATYPGICNLCSA